MRINITELEKRVAADLAYTKEEREFLLDCIAEVTTGKSQRSVTAYFDPGNYLGRIEHLWAYLSVDEGGEGVCAAPIGNLGTVPLIAADEKRLESITPFAKRIAEIFGKPVRLAKFTAREDVQVILP